MPMILLALGYAVVALPLGLRPPDPLEQGEITEHLTELGVIVSLMAAGLKIDRVPGLKAWSSTWRLLGITMMLSIVLTALTGWQLAAFLPATAVLLGAVIAPTDPVLAAEVQVGSPGNGSEEESGTEEAEDEVRFSLTSEAGLNDGLAFPFTHMALAMAVAGLHPGNWFQSWLLVDVFYKLGAGVVIGVALGYLLARIITAVPAKTRLAKTMIGMGSLAAALLIYGTTEYAGGYGFVATFAGAVTLRSYERKHEYHKSLHLFAEQAERIFMAVILLAFGGAIAGGLLEPLTWPLVVSAVLIVFILRPLSGIIGLLGFNRVSWKERLAISFFGIRGIGSLYYLSFALNRHEFPDAEKIWALVALVIVISVFVHGIFAAPVTSKLDKLREGKPR